MSDEQRDLPGRARAFVARHAWSLSLSALSALAFLELARELGAGRLGPLDRTVADWLQAYRGHLDFPMLALTNLGNLVALVALGAVPVLLLVFFRRRHEARYIVACGLGAAVINASLKLAFHRARPLATGAYLLPIPDSFSFPSGHAMGAISVIGSLVVLGRVLPLPRVGQIVAVVVGTLLVIGVGASRVYFGVHYPSDVIAGELAGAAWVAAMTGWFYPRLLPGEASGEPLAPPGPRASGR